MKKFDGVTIVLVVLAVAVTFYYVQQRFQDEAPVVVDRATGPEATVDEPEIKHPVPMAPSPPEAGAKAPEPLPALDESDGAVRKGLEDLAAPLSVDKIFVFENLIRHVVVTVDNIPEDRLPFKYRPFQSPGGQFMTQGKSEDAIFIDPENFSRYTPYVKLAEAIDSRQLTEFYIHYYPLFQQAYEELGYPSKYFNDRLIEVIDHLLDTPVVDRPLRLVRPHVFYQFADPQLEALSAGQKMLIRIGSDNAGRIKAKLRELRQMLMENREDTD